VAGTETVMATVAVNRYKTSINISTRPSSTNSNRIKTNINTSTVMGPTISTFKHALRYPLMVRTKLSVLNRPHNATGLILNLNTLPPPWYRDGGFFGFCDAVGNVLI